jgi:hypothetical protein
VFCIVNFYFLIRLSSHSPAKGALIFTESAVDLAQSGAGTFWEHLIFASLFAFMLKDCFLFYDTVDVMFTLHHFAVMLFMYCLYFINTINGTRRCLRLVIMYLCRDLVCFWFAGVKLVSHKVFVCLFICIVLSVVCFIASTHTDRRGVTALALCCVVAEIGTSSYCAYMIWNFKRVYAVVMTLSNAGYAIGALFSVEFSLLLSYFFFFFFFVFVFFFFLSVLESIITVLLWVLYSVINVFVDATIDFSN